MPNGGGDGGLPAGHIYVQETGALFGVKVASDAAAMLGDSANAATLATEFVVRQSEISNIASLFF